MNNQPARGGQRRQSAGRQVAERDAEADEFAEQRKEVEERIGKAEAWFSKVAPAHIDADQYVHLAVGHIRKDSRLAEAAIQNPASLMVALVECARLGLVVGDTYHLTHFKNRETGVPDIVGMVDYRGEIELIYRTGKVDAVICEVVRRSPAAAKPDQFLWRPGMLYPEHEIADDGLADEKDRGPLAGVYAYARLVSGGYSPCIVMSPSQIAKHRKMAKTDKFWGPEWPNEGPWTPDMWRKTDLHKLYDNVPHSVEYMQQMIRSASVAVEAAGALNIRPGVSALNPPDFGRPAIEGHAEPGDEGPSEGERRPPARGQIANGNGGGGGR